MAEVTTVSQFISNIVSRQAQSAYNAGYTMDMMDVRDELFSLENFYRRDPAGFAAVYGMPAHLVNNVS